MEVVFKQTKSEEFSELQQIQHDNNLKEKQNEDYQVEQVVQSFDYSSESDKFSLAWL